MSKHSKKTLTTITEIDTTPEQWGMTPTTVRAERRDMNLRVLCKCCYGSGVTYDLYAPRTYLSDPENIRTYYPNRVHEDDATLTIDEMYEASGQPDPVKYDGSEYPADEISSARWQEVKNGNRTLPREMGYFPLKGWPCKTCANGRHQYNRSIGIYANNSTGYVFEWTENVAVNAHYPAWPVGTEFTSRYDGHDCEACGKNHIKTGTYPVVAQRADGTHVGMFVGNTCVAKFGFKKFTPVDKQAERHANNRTEVVLDIHYRSKVGRADDLESEA
jgi:hypothetical protein